MRSFCYFCVFLSTVLPAFAETAPKSGEGCPLPSNAVSQDAAATPETATEVAVGDQWTFQVRDEITQTVKSLVTHTVTEITPKEISVSVQTLGKFGTGFLTYDHGWNLISTPEWRFSPHDGSGIQTPLTVGKTWTFRADDVSSAHGSSFKRIGNSKVIGQESLTTKAGTFDTCKVEISGSSRNANDPTKLYEFKEMLWYAPAINHWVKLTNVSRVDGRVNANTSFEIMEYNKQ